MLEELLPCESALAAAKFLITDQNARLSELNNLRQELYAPGRGTADAQGKLSDAKAAIEGLKLQLCKYTTVRVVVKSGNSSLISASSDQPTNTIVVVAAHHKVPLHRTYSPPLSRNLIQPLTY